MTRQPGNGAQENGAHPLRLWRDKLGLNLAQLRIVLAGHGVDVTTQHLGDIERSERWPSYPLAKVLQRVTKIPADTLVTFGRGESIHGKVYPRR